MSVSCDSGSMYWVSISQGDWPSDRHPEIAHAEIRTAIYMLPSTSTSMYNCCQCHEESRNFCTAGA
jgi:hypothetical protein